MSEFITMQQINAATDAVKARIKIEPEIALILGSGLGDLADAVENQTVIPTHEIPHWPVSTVLGHKGRLVIGMLESKKVLVLQGRSHYYEGNSMSKVGLPIRVMQRLGIHTIILTNAAGGLNLGFHAGDLMMITDHLSLLPIAGENPLRGPNLDEFGPRFPDMSHVYDLDLQEIAREVSHSEGIELKEGVYAVLAGPSFETPADCRFLRMIGADAVGMSTVPEAIVARHGGQRVLGISGISNKIAANGLNEATHEEVLTAGSVIVPKLTRILRGVLQKL
ncbi:MAG: purine-nucleoside phosphorylase [Anaerolineaceae bacterium]|jgi:purine-nucleoside phosphorylase